MPLSMKIQPIDAREEPEQLNRPEQSISKPPVVRSRLKRLFRISIADKSIAAGGLTGGADEAPAPAAADQPLVEPSSVCLAKMVQNFIEESNEKYSSSPAIKCGRHRCNCFNGNNSDGSDGDPDGADTSDFLKSLVLNSNQNERNVLADTAKIVEKNSKACKRKDELRKSVADGLAALGYDAAVCKSKWDKSPSFPAGEYEYVDVIIGDPPERLIVDVDFRSEFEIARSTKAYKSVLQTLPYIFVGGSSRLAKLITLVSEAARASLKKKGLHFPPWRKAEYVQAKWLSPHARLKPSLSPSPSQDPPTLAGNPLKPTNSGDLTIFSGDNEKEKDDDTPSSLDDQPIFAMSESSGDEDPIPNRNPPEKKGTIDFDLLTNA